ncbi:MAG: hypothetical protein IZT59_04430 [Verrucomicrobia bacterium]|jgi:hypothetical protein|nr:hypothetical protein [Verrucomicrobiota bacterium]|tara:strand:+ start:2376 stop:3347 length:972 start_codon:yes stop_codon:yes gene_type:complete
MTQGKKYGVLVLAILAAGGLRLPFERSLTNDLQAANLLPRKLEMRTGEKIGQTFSAVSLGGLRTLIATLLNLRAFSFFSEQKWVDVEDTFDVIVDLAPRTRYYWDTGSWHQAYNAASYYLYESEIPPLRRKLAWRESILKGQAFLERGIRNNPDDPKLYEGLGVLLSDSNKIAAFSSPNEAYEKSYEAFMAAVETGNARGYAKRAALYSLARVPGREMDALALANEIRKENPRLPPTVLGLLYTLNYHEDPAQDVLTLADSIFPNRKIAYEILGNQWMRTRDYFPVDGIARVMPLLEKELGVSEEDSVLKVKLLSPMNPDEGR